MQIHVHTTERRVDLVEDGIDVALRVGDIATEKLVARHMLPYRHLLVASPSIFVVITTICSSLILIEIALIGGPTYP